MPFPGTYKHCNDLAHKQAKFCAMRKLWSTGRACVYARGVFFFVSHLNIKMDDTMTTTESQILSKLIDKFQVEFSYSNETL